MVAPFFRYVGLESSNLRRPHLRVESGWRRSSSTDCSSRAPGSLQDDLTTYDVDFQHRFRIGAANSIVWGWGFRYTHDVVNNAPALAFLPPTLDRDLYSLFAQDEVALRPNLSLTLGSKLERNDYTGFEVEPNARLSWILDSKQALWSAISRAVRTPSRIDQDFYEAAPPHFVLLEGGSDFKSETVVAYELGYRIQLDQQLSASVSTFFNQYNDIRSTTFTPDHRSAVCTSPTAWRAILTAWNSPATIRCRIPGRCMLGIPF